MSVLPGGRTTVGLVAKGINSNQVMICVLLLLIVKLNDQLTSVGEREPSANQSKVNSPISASRLHANLIRIITLS